MVKITQTILIAAPPDDVFALACNYRNDPIWRGGVTEMRVYPEGKVRVGSRTDETMTFMGQRLRTTAEVVRYEPDREVAFRSLDGAMELTGFRSVSPSPRGTQFTYHLEAELRGDRKLMGPLLAWVFRRRLKADLRALKWQLEG